MHRDTSGTDRVTGEAPGLGEVPQGGHPPVKRGKVREFRIGQGKGKVMEIVFCLFCATTVVTVTK